MIICRVSFMLIVMESVKPTAIDFFPTRLISGKSLSAEEEDIDVARERDRVYSGKAQSDLLRIYDLTKVQWTEFHDFFYRFFFPTKLLPRTCFFYSI